MDDESKELLRQILLVQREQAAIIKTYLPPLWTKVRFSLLALLVVMTITAIGMGLTAYRIRSGNRPTVIPAATAGVVSVSPAVRPGTEVRPGQTIFVLPPPIQTQP
jgi:hypothetical protein